MTPVRAERQALCDSMLEAGPDAPTLCEGWTVLDLAAHLVVREERPDAAAGLVVPPLAGRLDRISAAYASRGLDALVARFRAGPPRWHPTAVPAVDALVNLAELVVHHEDVRRAAGMGPRTDVPELQEAVWKQLPVASGLALRGAAHVPVVAVSTDGRRRVLRRGPYPVVLTGAPVDLLLRLFGRSAAQVDVGGPRLSVQRFSQARLGV
ncbi:TIGR03085 family metal-binding protein [Aquipuribacter hungaricus]|uniref:TIGR03085 family metal-binding protein n=1 Tax=Aquipuribacter hungaricus TaxID=545624 RepID=A0ABV7WG18_9MICO